MGLVKNKIRFAGLLYLAGMLAGIFSVAPSVDHEGYLTEAAANYNQVIFAAVFQFAMSLAYIGIAILLYPVIRRYNHSLSVGFLSFRIIAVTLSIIATVLLLSVLTLSQEFVKNPIQSALAPEALGNVLRITRDYVNHVFMILILCTGNFMFFVLLLKSKLIPIWLSAWGLCGAILSSTASLLVLFQVFEIITTEYLVLNAPTAFQELILGGWLIFKGFDKRFIKINGQEENIFL